VSTTLSEAQIHRYSRQILLREVGGMGQLALLGGVVEVRGQGEALEVAGRYLAAGGTPVRAPFPLPGFDPELDATAPVRARLSSSAEVREPLPGVSDVLLGVEAGAVRIAYRVAGQGCPACFSAQVAAMEAAVDGARSVAAGALTALLIQRILIGALEGMGAVSLDDGGSLMLAPVRRCERCRRGD
jgi:hypothetical protein